MIPVIAIVGRPNVGKSTLFNRLTRSNDALVADHPGLTRDRIYGQGKVGDRDYILIDTGGLTGNESGIDSVMAGQSLQAIEEADAVLLVTDARDGLTPVDEHIAAQLRRSGKPTYLVVNKIDGTHAEVSLSEFYALGIEPLFGIAAAHNRGVSSMMESLLSEIPAAGDASALERKGIQIAVVGRPNVGKSTLVNRMLGEDRAVVYDQPGTTRDSLYIPYTRFDRDYTLIDTAGVRRRKNITEAVEKFSIVKTLQAIRDANVVIVLFDAREGIVDQDLHMLSFVLEAGRSLLIAINKWDGMDLDKKRQIKSDIERRLGFVDYAETHFISAMHGTGVGDLYDSIHSAYQSATAKWPTNRLTKILQQAVIEHMPPLVRGRRIKLRFAHQGGSNPPRIVIHGNQTEELPQSYKRYLEKRYRKLLRISGSPVFIEFKTGSNPFAGKKNPLTQRQLSKKKRLLGHAKKP